MKGGPCAITQMHFPGICLVKQTEQKFRHIRGCLKFKKSERL